jgi:transcriptional regulator with XRE-family HTH domain
MKNNEFGNILKELRLEKNISQRKLGQDLGVVNQTISFWESGSREPDLDTLVKIAQYFNVTIDYLLGNSKF